MRPRHLLPALSTALLLLGCARAPAGPQPMSSTAGGMQPPATPSTTSANLATTVAPPLTPSTTGAPPADTVQATALPAFTTLNMVDGKDGWGATAHDLFRTADGGRTWAADLSLPSSTGPLVAGFSGGASAWAAVPSSATALTVYRTADGGHTWSQASIPVQGLVPRFLTFADPRHGWLWASHGAAAGSEAGLLLATTDGGAHWSQVADSAADGSGGIPFTGIKNGFLFTGALSGWMVRTDPARGAVLLYTTQDGGRRWTPVPTPPPATGWDAGYIQPPVVSGATVLVPMQWVAVDQRQTPNPFRWVFYTSHDDGRTWSPTAPTPLYLGPFSFLNPADGVAVRGDHVEATENGGTTWRPIAPSPPVLRGDVQMDFVSPTTGFADVHRHAVAWQDQPGDQLFTTHDGGQSWTQLS